MTESMRLWKKYVDSDVKLPLALKPRALQALSQLHGLGRAHEVPEYTCDVVGSTEK